jgi:hypothetical protein
VIELLNAEFVLSTPAPGKEGLESFATALFLRLDEYATRQLPFNDYAFHLEVEDGSIKGRANFLAKATVFYFAIGQFGSFVEGVERIADLTGRLSHFVIEEAPRVLGLEPKIVLKARRGSGVPGKLRRLFVDVKRGTLTADEATSKAIALLASEDVVPPGLQMELQAELNLLPKNSKQLLLPFDQDDLFNYRLPPTAPPHKAPRSLVDRMAPPADKWRVEVWREDGEGKHRVRVIHL